MMVREEAGRAETESEPRRPPSQFWAGTIMKNCFLDHGLHVIWLKFEQVIFEAMEEKVDIGVDTKQKNTGTIFGKVGRKRIE